MKYGTIQSLKRYNPYLTNDEIIVKDLSVPVRDFCQCVGEDNIMYLVYHLFLTFTFISLVLQLTVTWDTSISKHIYLYKHYAFNISLLELVFYSICSLISEKYFVNKNNIVNIYDIHWFVILNIWKYLEILIFEYFFRKKKELQ